jgi:hypothetical protein
MTKAGVKPDPPLGSESHWEKISSLEPVRDAINHDAGLNWTGRGGGESTLPQEKGDFKDAAEYAEELFYRLSEIGLGSTERRK